MFDVENEHSKEKKLFEIKKTQIGDGIKLYEKSTTTKLKVMQFYSVHFFDKL